MEKLYQKSTYTQKDDIIICFTGLGKWKKENKKFCHKCNEVYDTMKEAKTACLKDSSCRVIYELFCDDLGYFCTCPMWSVREQTHPKAVDCIYVKVTGTNE